MCTPKLKSGQSPSLPWHGRCHLDCQKGNTARQIFGGKSDLLQGEIFIRVVKDLCTL